MRRAPKRRAFRRTSPHLPEDVEPRDPKIRVYLRHPRKSAIQTRKIRDSDEKKSRAMNRSPPPRHA